MQRSLNIGIVGYGKMGKMVEAIALERGHAVAFIASKATDTWTEADVIIEFSRPEAVLGNISQALEQGIAMVTGTTGWNQQLSEVATEVQQKQGALLYASNFSIGVNLFFELNQKLAKLMNGHRDYAASIEEIHHTQKLDSPSGTAITLAEQLISNHENYDSWCEGEEAKATTLNIAASREPEVPGTHIVRWENDIDRIELKHEAKNRRGFATGAVIAAEWLAGRQGLFNMQDVLKQH